MNLKARNVLVVAAHPDDETLGCGGTLARLQAMGCHVRILLLGEGPLARENEDAFARQVRAEAQASALKAAEVLGIKEVYFASLPDNRFDSICLLEVIKKIEAVAEEFQPDIVFTHHSGDLNLDHVITNRAVMTAFRPLPGVKVPAILAFEVLSSTEYSPPGLGMPFQPTVYIDIEQFLELKQKALAAYASEMRPWPHPRSHEAVEHLARLRGSQCGNVAAEGFVLLRGVW